MIKFEMGLDRMKGKTEGIRDDQQGLGKVAMRDTLNGGRESRTMRIALCIVLVCRDFALHKCLATLLLASGPMWRGQP
jgi:hypothetical protein